MSASKHINKICAVVMIIAVVITVLFMNGAAFGIVADDSVSLGYEDTLFDDSFVHTIEIEIDDWDSFIENATSEEYANADVTIDREKVKNVGIRGKGNTSLSTVAQLGSERYSLKIEFDCYEASGNYHGLDKLCLNNLIQDYTMMKDYLAYKLMGDFGVPAPLVSFAFITVNGEDWGLYLAAEAVEDSFLERNYGSAYGALYKPDSMDMGGGRGNGGGFDMKDIDFDELGMKNPFEQNSSDKEDRPEPPEGFSGGAPDGGGSEGFPGGGGPGGAPGGGGPGGFGMGSSDAKLQYIDDEIDSYSTIFDSAKTTVKTSDKKRLIRSLKSLSEGIDEQDPSLIEEAVDTDEVMRYMVVHNFLVNGDSYTGSMIHNYYLYEEDGLLSMIPWDYNLAYGTFQANDADAAVNDPIDTPLSVTDGSTDRPMFSWITSTEEYTSLYHAYYQEFLEKYYSSGYLSELMEKTSEMLHDYVDRDPTKFCTTEEYEQAVKTLSAFVNVRCESIEGQLEGTIPSTDAGQEADASRLIDASSITLSEMGSMGGGGGFPGGPGGSSSEDRGNASETEDTEAREKPTNTENTEARENSSDTESTENRESFSPGGNFPGGGFPGGDFSGGPDGFPGAPGDAFPGGSGSSVSTEAYVTAGISVSVLAGGLLFALFFRRKK